mmetsp:Transcript_55171/g.106442  ORF Transcript_55171/g.106442 Transcript_55171/m.106442 type:complete len:92 (-) Transcript_55171:30-305(-)
MPYPRPVLAMEGGSLRAVAVEGGMPQAAQLSPHRPLAALGAKRQLQQTAVAAPVAAGLNFCRNDHFESSHSTILVWDMWQRMSHIMFRTSE